MSVEQPLSPTAKRMKVEKNEELRQHSYESNGETNETEQRCLLNKYQPSPSGIDFIKLLPAEIRELILLYLDCKALTAACCVNKTWYELITPCSRVWRRACRRLDLIIRYEEEDRDDKNYWKTLFLQAYKRRRQMSRSESFVYCAQKTEVPLTAIYYYNGKLATASANRKIKIWKYGTNVCLLTVTCNASISSIKFDDFVLMAATNHGLIESWDVKMGFLKCCYRSSLNTVSCFDYARNINLVAGGFQNNSIHIWEMSTAEKKMVLNDHTSAVINIILRSHLAEEDSQEQQILLLSMDKETIFVRYLSVVSETHSTSSYLKALARFKLSSDHQSCAPRPFAPKVEHCVRLIAQSSRGALHVNTKSVFSESFEGFGSSVFKFDGESLYFAFQGDTLCKWDLNRKYIVTNTYDKRGKIIAILGIGKLYMTFIVLWENEKLVFFVVDKKSRKTISCFPLPMNAPDEAFFDPQSHTSRLCLGEESWLDGFDSKNDEGAMLVAAPEPTRLFMLQWKPKNE